MRYRGTPFLVLDLCEALHHQCIEQRAGLLRLLPQVCRHLLKAHGILPQHPGGKLSEWVR